MEETDPRVEVEGALTEEDGGKRASSVLCRGQWPHSSSAPNALLTFGASDVLDFTTARSGGHRKVSLSVIVFRVVCRVVSKVAVHRLCFDVTPQRDVVGVLEQVLYG